MKTGSSFFYETHANCIKGLFGIFLKAFLKSIWETPDHKYNVWFTRLDGEMHQGWIDSQLDENTIQEYKASVGEVMPYDPYKNRLVFKFIGEGIFRKYIFMGIYQYQPKESDPSCCRIYKKISDEYTFH